MNDDIDFALTNNIIEVNLSGSAPGAKGETGEPGYTPIKGVDYFDGEPGPQGEPGTPGPQGETGEPGYTPIKGVDYFDGEPGPQGEPGTPGPQGETGEPGYTPIKGVDYFDGEPGPQGEPGTPGPQGETGEPGYTPIKGVDYFDGAPGVEGEPGYTPIKGVDYFDGLDAVINGVNVLNLLGGTNIEIDQLGSDMTISAPYTDIYTMQEVNDILTDYIRTDGSGSNINELVFKTDMLDPLPPIEEGVLRWNKDERTLDIGMNSGHTVQQVGLETYYPKTVNSDTVLIKNGELVMYAGTIGNSGQILVKRASLDMALPGLAMGLATEDMPVGEVGRVTWFGLVREIQTNGANYGETWVDGTILYNSSTVAGGLSKNKPVSPRSAVMVGIVINAHGSNGAIFIRPQFFPFLDHLSDVNAAGAIEGQVLMFNFADKVWEAKTLPLPDMGNYYTKTEIDNIVSAIYKFKGSVATYSELELILDAEVGDVYNVLDTDDNYAWDGLSWNLIGKIIPMATEEQDGLMSKENYAKLGTIEDSANNYVLPADVVIDSSYVHTDNNFSNLDVAKLEGVEDGAQVNVNSDWEATTGDAEILNKPTVLNFVGYYLEGTLPDLMESKENDLCVVGYKKDIYVFNDANGWELWSESSSSATEITITNAGGFFTGTTVDEALEELGAELVGALELINSGGILEIDANQVNLLDSGEHYTSTDVEGALAEVATKGYIVDAEYVHTDNNYTTVEKNKLAGIEENSNNYTLPTASTEVLGGVKVGTNLSIDEDGILSASGSDQAIDINISDNDNYFTSTNVEGALQEIGLKLDGLQEALDLILGSVPSTNYWEGTTFGTNTGYLDGEDLTYFSFMSAEIPVYGFTALEIVSAYDSISLRDMETEQVYNSVSIVNGMYSVQINFAGDLTGGLYEMTIPKNSLKSLAYHDQIGLNDVELKIVFDLSPWSQFGEGFTSAELSPAGDVVYFGGNVAVQAVDDTVMINAYYDAQLTQLAFTTTQINNNGYSITGLVGNIPEGEYYVHIPAGYLELVDVPGSTNENEYVIQLFVNIFTDSFYSFSKTIEEGNTLLSMTNNRFDFNLVNTESFLISAFNYSTYTALNILSATNTDTGIELLIEGEPTGYISLMVGSNQIYIIGSDPIRTNTTVFAKGFML